MKLAVPYGDVGPGFIRAMMTNIAYLLNGRVVPDDQFDCLEQEVTFVATATPQAVVHGLEREPLRVEVVRADQAGTVYVTAKSDTQVSIATDATGTYRIRVW